MNLIAIPTRVLTDPPAVARLKRLFAQAQEDEELLTEHIDLRRGDVEAHYKRREQVREEKRRLTLEIFELQRLRP